ncbi:MAG: DUF6875 domain-containing protein [Waddliaceae bacterium]
MIEPGSLCAYSKAMSKITDYPFYKTAMDWLEQFISKPHPDLGREGIVCPFVPISIRKDLVTFGVMRTQKNSQEEAVEKMLPLIRLFLDLEPSSGANKLLKSLIIFFPDVRSDEAYDFIDVGHSILKRSFVDHGLMIGEFHSLSRQLGYHNKNFYPMVSPMPAFVIRHMSAHDIKFLNIPEVSIEDRRHFLESYLKFMGDTLSADHLKKVREIVADLC